MKLKSIVFVMSCLLVLGVSANVFAVTDSIGEPLTSVTGALNVDIATASVQTSDLGTGGTSNRANLGVRMAPGSHIPASLIFDFDVDNDTATGGDGTVVTSLPSRQCGGSPCKANAGPGFDFYLNLVLRSQDPGAAFSNCAGCTGLGGGSCAFRGDPGVGCTAGSACFELGTSCNVTDANCYETAGQCSGCSNTATVFSMANLCGTTPAADGDCSRSFVKGEWNVGFGQNGRVMNGNVNVGIDFAAKDEPEICFEVPWALIVAEAWTEISRFGDPEHLPFDPEDNADINAPKFQVTAIWDPGWPFDGDDFRQDLPAGTGFNLAVRDWLPDTDRVADGEYSPEAQCLYNQDKPYADPDVDGFDLSAFLTEFGRGGYDRPCPNCTD